MRARYHSTSSSNTADLELEILYVGPVEWSDGPVPWVCRQREWRPDLGIAEPALCRQDWLDVPPAMTHRNAPVEIEFLEVNEQLVRNAEFYRVREAKSLDHLWFMFPVRLRVRDAEFFCNGGRWVSLPVLSVGSHLLYVAGRAMRRGTAQFDASEGGIGPPLLLTRLDDALLEIARTDIDLREQIQFADLAAALHRFAEDLRAYLLPAIPGLATDLLWHEWFASDDLNVRTV